MLEVCAVLKFKLSAWQIMLPNCFLVIHITILCPTAIIMVTEIGIRSPTGAVCLYLLMKCSS